MGFMQTVEEAAWGTNWAADYDAQSLCGEGCMGTANCSQAHNHQEVLCSPEENQHFSLHTRR
jgi:hypothetical protein